MENLVTFNTDACIRKMDVVYLPFADVAYNLGFTNRTTRHDESRPQVADKIFESVRWVRVQKYLKDIFESEVVKEEAKYNRLLAEDMRNAKEADYKPKLISESVFYMLAMKANNERALKFQLWISYELVPSVIKYGFYFNPKWGKVPKSGKWTLANGEQLTALQVQQKAREIGCTNVEDRRIQSLVDDIDYYKSREGIKERYPYTIKDIEKTLNVREGDWYEHLIPEGADWDEYLHWTVEETRYTEKYVELVKRIEEKNVPKPYRR